jgi:hypothetical protein
VGNNLQAAQYVSPEICSINGPQKLSVSRSELINFIQSLGYKSDKEGICFGLGMMAIQAILCDDLQTYAYRLNRIAILINLSKQPESDRNLMLSLDEKNELILAVENDVDLHAFLNGVDLHHNSADYPHLLSDSYDALGHKPLEKHLARIAPIIAPCQLQEEGGIAIAKDFTRIYDNTDTFELFLNQLENLFQEDEPSAIGLFTYNHMLAISYNGKSINGKSTWIIIDHGWVCIYYKETLAKYIYAVTAPNYNQTPCRPIRIVIFSNASDIQPLRAILNYRYPNLLDIPPLSEAQLKLVNDPLYQLLMLDNEVDLGMFQSALQQGMVLAVQNKDFSVFWKCFIRDSHIRAIDFVRIIIETVGIACLEQTDLSGQTCLLAAVEANKIPFVKLLLKAGAKHDHQDQNGKTPLEIALEKLSRACTTTLLATTRSSKSMV